MTSRWVRRPPRAAWPVLGGRLTERTSSEMCLMSPDARQRRQIQIDHGGGDVAFPNDRGDRTIAHSLRDSGEGTTVCRVLPKL
jgi:hypothetical protein